MPSSIRSTHALLAAFAALGGFLSLSNAQSVATTPVGAMTYALPATGAVPATNSQFAVVLSNPAVFSGAVSAVGTNTITVSGTPFTAGGLAQVGSPYFVKIVSGAQAGRSVLVTANTTSQVTVDTTDNSTATTDLTTSGFAVAVGDKIEIVVGDTLASFFGDNTVGNPLILVGGNGALQADTIGIYNKVTSKQDAYFYSTTLGYWRLSSNTANANNLVLYPETAYSMTRRANRTASSFTVLGDVPKVSQKIKFTPQATPSGSRTIFTNLSFPANTTFGQLNLTNWTKSNSAISADTIGIFNPVTSKNDVYFQRLDNQWRKSTDLSTDQSGTVIPAGAPVTVLKRGIVSSGPTSYFSAQLPYSL
jgi:uncharacterized protein (TIGR02597 family)